MEFITVEWHIWHLKFSEFQLQNAHGAELKNLPTAVRTFQNSPNMLSLNECNQTGSEDRGSVSMKISMVGQFWPFQNIMLIRNIASVTIQWRKANDQASTFLYGSLPWHTPSKKWYNNAADSTLLTVSKQYDKPSLIHKRTNTEPLLYTSNSSLFL